MKRPPEKEISGGLILIGDRIIQLRRLFFMNESLNHARSRIACDPGFLLLSASFPFASYQK